jgi:hypothetical protein
MKQILFLAGVALMATVGGCQTSEPSNAYANPVEACAQKPTEAERDACMKNVVADVRMSVKREASRKPPR